MDFHSDRNLPGHGPIFQEHTYLGVTFSEASGLLLLWSMLVINEGSIRYMRLIDPTGGGLLQLDKGRPANGWLFFASVAEIAFGIMGLLLAVAGFIFRFYNTRFVQTCMTIQAVLSIFVFVIYVFVVPSFLASDAKTSPLPNISLPLYRTLIVLGMFTSAHFCLALQGGQFVFMARLISAATGDDFLRHRSGDRMRAIFWSANITLAGFWTLITGAIINARVGGGKMISYYHFPPNVGRLPGLTITTGLLMFLFGAAGVMFSVLDTIAPQVYYVAAIIVFLFSWLNFTIAQFSIIGPNPGAVSMHSGLIFMLIFLGTYFVWCYSKDTGFSEEKM